jgi:tripartite-type tricarboxylate transporter receptor subunit TctC
LAGAWASLAEYPERPIRLLLPFPAGGTVDIVARVMTAKSPGWRFVAWRSSSLE